MTNEAQPCVSLAVYLRFIVEDAAAAIGFYEKAFDAVELVRFADPSGKIVHAEVQIGDDVVSLSESDGETNRSPSQLGGSPVIAMLTTPDVDEVAQRMMDHGGTAIFPIDDREYGQRDGRYADPEGHVWILTQVNEELSNDEIQARLEE